MASTTAPPHRDEPYRGTDRTIEVMEEAIQGPRGSLSLELRLAIEEVIRHIRPRDKLSQMAALYNWFFRHYHFVSDPVSKEQVKDPQLILDEINQKGRALGDCDDASTFLSAACRTIGIKAHPARTAFRQPALGSNEGPFTHVLAVGYDQLGRAVVLDPVAGGHTKQMLRRVKQIKVGTR